ncbi:hypothetical protein AQUCO_01000109v1 [Aquilegia coerulea]|uniref:Uncharacterized protein n=1 Tax=Aquilegia coerulea TaxID=218851 RepID=A0A2G5E8C9_AQUCA|nr:hypothetical protein AQUCO_01000109v1 [Aquilegia coerulea]
MHKSLQGTKASRNSLVFLHLVLKKMRIHITICIQLQGFSLWLIAGTGEVKGCNVEAQTLHLIVSEQHRNLLKDYYIWSGPDL